MSQIRLYLDEDATNNRLLQALRHRGADVISTIEAGRLAQSDVDQLEWALIHRRVIYSFNVRDFYRLHTEWLEQSRLMLASSWASKTIQLEIKCGDYCS